MTDAFRCAECERILTDPNATRCAGCSYQSGDVVMTPSGDLWQATWDRYKRRVEWQQLLPLGHHTNEIPDSRAVLLRRTVDGQPLPVVALTDGDLYAVRAVS